MTKAQFEKEVVRQMKALGISREEAEDLVADDNDVDKMSMKELNASMTKEEKEAVKAMTKTTSGEKKERKPRERKVDETKVEIIEKLAEFAKNLGENVEIVKKEREIAFKIGEDDYSIQLVKHRKPKN